jgi:putative membrane protein insertion efficiency factor
VRKALLKSIKFYQNISKFTPNSCRYYPSCSEYAKWLFLFDNPLLAIGKVTKRILSCNQLFLGGIDYPKFDYKPPKLVELDNRVYREKRPHQPLKIKDKKSKLTVQFWLIPHKDKFYIVKDFDGTTTK